MSVSNLLKRLTRQIKVKSKVINHMRENYPEQYTATSAPKIKKTASEKAWEQAKSGNVFSKENVLKQDLFKPSPSLSQDQAKAAIKARLALNDTMKRVKEAERQRKLAEWQKQKPKPMAGSYLTNEDVVKIQNVARQPVTGRNATVEGFDKLSPGFKERVRKQTEKSVKDAPHVAGFFESSVPFAPTGNLRKQLEGTYGKMDVDDAYKSKRFMAGSAVGMATQYAMTGGIGAGAIQKGIMAKRGLDSAKLGTQLGSRAGADFLAGLPVNITDSAGRSENAKEFAKNLAINSLLDVGVGGAMALPGAKKAVRAIAPKGANPEKWAKLSEKEKKAVLKVLGKKNYSVENPKVDTNIDNAIKPSTNSTQDPVGDVNDIPQPNKTSESPPRSDNSPSRGSEETEVSTNIPPSDPSVKWTEAQKAGTYPGGTPKNIEGEKVQKGIDTAMRGDMTDEAKEIVKSDILSHELDYTSRKHSNLLRISESRIEKDPDTVMKKIKGFTETGGVGAKDSDISDGVALMTHARKVGDPKLEAETAEALSLMLNETGRTLSAARMLLRATPQGRLRIATKLADNLTERNMKTGKGGEVTLPKENADEIIDAKTPEQIEEANLKAQTALWNQVPATWKEKADSWRYMAMLTNPKTHIRNVIGNIMFAFPRAIKNALGDSMESVAQKAGKIEQGERTKAFLPGKESIDFGKADFAKMKTTLRGQSAKFSDSLRPQDSRVFNNRVLEKIRQGNATALDAEDILMMKPAYARAMGSYMKSNNLKPADMVGEVLQKARSVSSEEALRATYRDYTALGGWLSKMKNPDPDATVGRKIAGYTVDAIMPFTKTPINIMRRGFDYSPFGLMKGVGKLVRSKTSAEAVKAIDDLSAGLTGTGIFGLGVFLNQQGIIELKIEGDATGSYIKDLGAKNYSLKVGDTYITLDWAVPMAMPFFLGAQASETFKDGFELADIGTILDASAKVFDPTMELSVMQGMSNALGSVKFKDSPGEMALALATSVGTNYLSQYQPTLMKQVARFNDPTQRSTRSTAESAGQRTLESFTQRLRGGVPGLSQQNEPYIDKWGREVTDDRSTALRAFETFLSPAYFSTDKSTRVDDEILRLNEKLDDDEKTSVIPKGLSGYTLKLDGKEQRLERGDLTTYNKAKGKEAYIKIKDLIDTDEYKAMSDSDKATAVAKVYKNAGKEAKATTLIKMGNDEWKVYTDEMKGNRKEMSTVAKNAGLDAKQYRDLFQTEGQYADGKQNWSQYDAYQALEATDLSTEQKASIWNAYNKTWKRNPYLHGYVPEKGGSSGGGKSGGRKGRSAKGGRSGKGGRSAKAPKPIKTESEKLFTKATSGNIDYRFKMPQNLSTSERKAILKLLKKKFNA